MFAASINASYLGFMTRGTFTFGRARGNAGSVSGGPETTNGRERTTNGHRTAGRGAQPADHPIRARAPTR
jgi:hypothetical protein